MSRGRTSETLVLAAIVGVAWIGPSDGFATPQLHAQAAPGSATPVVAPRDLSATLAPLLEKHDLPGMVAVTIEGWNVAVTASAGVRKRGSPEKITLGDRFHIGSCTKAMTATLCARLVQERRLRFESTLVEVWPELREKFHADYRGVTLEQLLTHRSGMPADLDAGGLWQRLWAHKGTPTAARHELLLGVASEPPAASLGTSFIYSNAGFAVAGHMAETVQKKSWEDLMRSQLFEPLGMKSAGFGAPGTPERIDQPRGHTEDGKSVEPGPHADNPPAIGPAGTVHCSIEDWAKFVALHLRGAQGDARILSKESFAKLHAPVGSDERYAMGWGVQERVWGGGTVLTHNGSNTMWFCVTWVAPKRDFAVLVACNQGGDAAELAIDEAASLLIADHEAHARKK